MPELPEVEVVRAGLEPAVTGAVIRSVAVYDERSLRRHVGPSEDFVERLEGRGILGAVRRGKFLWLPLSAPPAPSVPKMQEIVAQPVESVRSGAGSAESPAFSEEALVVHLGMSGQVLLRDMQQPDDALLRIRLDLVHPTHGELRVAFVDQRIFGSMAINDLVPTPDGAAGGFGHPAALVPAQVAHIARDPLDPAFDDDRFLADLRKRKTGIKRAMLDQGLVSGIGNIYADESLWAARIHYDQPTDTLSRARARTLLTEVRLVLAKALAEGGTSFDAQYVNVNGASGYFSHSLNAYGQQDKPCPRCGRPIIRESFMNRGSHFCAFCQRIRSATAR
ncbi:bifunctional DNA-formamidopyrimidine glycosylase/DNA-(apurinic or apyrimidinic site) lyase [Glaciihabitans sp. UYNi722]|uniref:bifunctional DNA-formamidopyrimidine glycosylase/DNA-(apurinic or apyrimidinic site) lyase n=1 Tax=Glaciihabitans sp. UYNi722 TaxID=3156344 RepID=UPI00339948BC